MILPYILFLISDIIFCVIYYIKKVLIEINLYEIIFYFSNDKSGVGNGVVIWEGIKLCLPILILFLIICVGIWLILVKYNVKLKMLFPVSLIVIGLLILIRVVKLDEYVINLFKNTNIYEEHYVDTNNVKVSFPKDKKNLVLIYLESMESSLVSKENGGAFNVSRIPELERIALDNINFSNTSKLGGGKNITASSFTMASLISSNTATPPDISLIRGYSEKHRIMPNVKTLGDQLYENGYNLEIIQGSDLKYSRTDLFYKDHGNHILMGYKEMINKKYIPEDYVKWWGVEDKTLLDISKKEISELASLDKPFAVTIFTMDTHFKDGYLDSECDNVFEEQIDNVYACNSKMVNEFINWIKLQDFYENTTIVLIGDHLTMQSSMYSDHEDYERRIYNAFINSSVDSIKSDNREFTNFDMYPTILASLGATIEGEKLGFGTNLFSNEKTLIEEIGFEKLEKELLKKSKYYKNKIVD